MNLVFLHPLLLWGLAATAIPVLIHRLTQKNAPTRNFSAVRLLLQSQKVMARPQRLKHLILLALRILAVATLVLLVAGPVLRPQALVALSESGFKVLLVDNSLSMGYREERGQRLEVAKKAAKELLENSKSRCLIIPTAPSAGTSPLNMEPSWMGAQEAAKAVESLSLSFGRGDPQAALNLAYAKLQELKGPKEILVLSDLARGDWERFIPGQIKLISSDPSLTFLRIGGPDPDANLALKGLELAEGEAVVGVPARLAVTVSNFSERSATTLVSLYLSGVKVDQKSLQLKAGAEDKVFFELYLDRPGWLDGEIRLSGDSLPLDDLFYFPLQVREKAKILLVDGDPRPALKSGESYYLVNALSPGGSEGSPFSPRVVGGNELASVDLKPYDALLLLNVDRPAASRMASFLETGKPVFIFLGDKISPEAYNRLPFFPWEIMGAKEASPPQRIAQADYSHEALRPFAGAGGESLRSAQFSRYFQVEGSGKNLLTLGSRDPLLVQGEIGKGRLFLFTSSADPDWNDLPLKASYLPLVQGLLKAATGLSRDSLPAGRRYGEPFEEKSSPVQIRGPRGGPGIYGFSLPSGEGRRGLNLPLEESDLKKISQGDLQKKFGPVEPKVVEYQEGLLKKARGERKELWPFLLGFLLVVLGVEMGVASRP